MASSKGLRAIAWSQVMLVFSTVAAGSVETRCSLLWRWQSRRLRCHPEWHCSWPPEPSNDSLLSRNVNLLTVCSRKNHSERRVPTSPTYPFTRAWDAQEISFSAQHHTAPASRREKGAQLCSVTDRAMRLKNSHQSFRTCGCENLHRQKRTLQIWLNKGFKWKDYPGLSREPRPIR